MAETPMEPGQDARIVAALDQLRAALSIEGLEMVEPVVVICRERVHDGLVVFYSGVSDTQVSVLLRAVAKTHETRSPDVTLRRSL